VLNTFFKLLPFYIPSVFVYNSFRKPLLVSRLLAFVSLNWPRLGHHRHEIKACESPSLSFDYVQIRYKSFGGLLRFYALSYLDFIALMIHDITLPCAYRAPGT